MKSFVKIIILAVMFVAQVGFAKLPAAEKMMPEDTFVMFSVENVQQFNESFEKTDVYKLFTDPAMKPFVDKFKNAFEDIKKKTNKFDFMFEGKDVKPQGRSVFGVLFNEKTFEGGNPTVVGAMEFGDNLENAKKAVDKAIEMSIDAGATRKKQNMMGVEVTTLINDEVTMRDPNSGNAMARKVKEINIAFVDDAFVFSMDADMDVFAYVLGQAKGKGAGNSLGESADFVSAMQATQLSNSIDMFVNIKPILEIAKKKNTSANPEKEMEALGLSNISCLAMQLNSDDKTNNLQTKSLLKINGEKKGIMKMFEPGNKSLNVPGFVDSSAGSISFINWDINKAFGVLSQTLMTIQPQAAMMLGMAQIPSPDGTKMLTLQNDLLAHLGSQIVVAVTYDDDQQDDMQYQSSVVAIETSNAAKLEETISAVHGMFVAAANPELKRDFMGRSIYLIDASKMGQMMGGPGMMNMNAPQPAAMPIMPKVGITVTDKYLVIGAEADVEKVLRKLDDKDGKKLDEMKWYSVAKSKVPSSVGFAEFVNNRENLRVLWKMIKAKGVAAFNPMLAGQTGEFDKFVDFSLLPDYEVIEKYIGISTSYMKSTEDGFYYEAKSLDVPK